MRSELRDFLEREGVRPESLRQLAGDASSRRYHRARTGGGASVVVMEAGAPLPEPFPQERWQRFYADLGIRVPEHLATDRATGLVLLEDFGDELLQHRVERRGPTACRGHYLLATEWGRRLAEAGTPRFTPDAEDSDDPLSPARLAREMDFFLRHSLGIEDDALKGAGGALREARESLAELCRAVHAGEAGPREMVLCHRDYHARNLMVLPRDDGGAPALGVVDFQDTRRGPRAYDLASLVFDPYVSLPDALAGELVEAWRPEAVAPEAWGAELALAAGQRLIKAAGSYAWLGHGQGRREYLRWYGPALDRAFAQLRGWEGVAELRAALEGAGVEW